MLVWQIIIIFAEKFAPMKKASLFLLTVLACAALPAAGQTIALGERAPELKVQSWLEDRIPAEAPKS